MNDQIQHAEALVTVLQNLRCKVNLIPLNPFPGSGYERSQERDIYAFQTVLMQAGFVTMIRTTRGEDIDAACGQLVGMVGDRTRRQAEISRSFSPRNFGRADSLMAIVDDKVDGGPGQVFIDGRESLGMTPEQAAMSLNLSVKAIKAIENDDAGSLPEIVYVNGYIRSYAKLLGIAPEPLIAAWRAQHVEPENEPLELDWSKDATQADEMNVRPLKMGRWALMAICLSAAFVYFVTSSGDGTVSQVQPTGADVLVASQTPDRELPAAAALNSADMQVSLKPERDESAA